MKLKVVCKKVYDYIRYDLKEIAFPSSLPDPPHIKKRRTLTWHDRFLVLKEASRLYAASWVRDIGPELRPNDYKKHEESESESEDKPSGAKSKTKEKEPSTLEDLEKTVWTRGLSAFKRDNRSKLKNEESSELSTGEDICKAGRSSDLNAVQSILSSYPLAINSRDEISTIELPVAARGGMETLRPALQRVYMTRASAYRDGLKSFIEGYQEGVQQVMEKKEESNKSQQEGNAPKN